MAGPDAMSCQELIELVTEYFERALPPAEQARFERHLGACADCGNYLDQMRRTIQLVGMLEEQDISEEAKEQLLQAFHSWKRSG